MHFLNWLRDNGAVFPSVHINSTHTQHCLLSHTITVIIVICTVLLEAMIYEVCTVNTVRVDSNGLLCR